MQQELIHLNQTLKAVEQKLDEIDANKLKAVSVDWSKLSNIANNDVIKKTVYDKLVAEVNNIDISIFVLKNKYDTDKSKLEKKIPAISEFVKNNRL